MNHTKIFDRSIIDYFSSVLKANITDLSAVPFLLRTALKQKKAAKVRARAQKEGVNVPPLIIFSVTNRCNLGCSGCYNKMREGNPEKELDTKEMTGIIGQADSLGVSIVLFAGGEPLLRKDIFRAAGSFRDIIFPVFTNGLEINAETVRDFRLNRNMIPIISVEGGREATDLRRGPGTFERIESILSELKKQGLVFGVSITATSENFSEITGHGFISALRALGCRLFFYVEYVPVDDTLKYLVIGEEKKKRLLSLMKGFDLKYKAVFITFPGNEDVYGGCLASGRGFVHVSPCGDLEPCPFSPYSDVNLRNTPLKDALSSKLLKELRANHSEFKETGGGCALWNKREWVASLLK